MFYCLLLNGIVMGDLKKAVFLQESIYFIEGVNGNLDDR